MDLEKIRQERFKENNGKVLRAVNMLHKNCVRIKDLELGLSPDINHTELTDCINYLLEAKYIKLRNFETHENVDDIADAEICTLEGKLTAKGISFLAGAFKDDCIRR